MRQACRGGERRRGRGRGRWEARRVELGRAAGCEAGEEHVVYISDAHEPVRYRRGRWRARDGGATLVTAYFRLAPPQGPPQPRAHARWGNAGYPARGPRCPPPSHKGQAPGPARNGLGKRRMPSFCRPCWYSAFLPVLHDISQNGLSKAEQSLRARAGDSPASGSSCGSARDAVQIAAIVFSISIGHSGCSWTRPISSLISPQCPPEISAISRRAVRRRPYSPTRLKRRLRAIAHTWLLDANRTHACGRLGSISPPSGYRALDRPAASTALPARPP